MILFGWKKEQHLLKKLAMFLCVEDIFELGEQPK